jgi:hypothetical protein
VKNDYRPNMADFTPTKTQQLSLRDAGQFDKKFQIVEGGKVVGRKATTGWTLVCQKRRAQ